MKVRCRGPLLLLATHMVGCAGLLAVGEGQVPVCEGASYDTFDGRLYRIWRAEAGRPPLESRLHLEVTRSCVVAHPEDLSDLGIDLLRIEHPRGPMPLLAAEIAPIDPASPPAVCRGRLEESGEMILHCPEEMAGIAFHLEPAE